MAGILSASVEITLGLGDMDDQDGGLGGCEDDDDSEKQQASSSRHQLRQINTLLFFFTNITQRSR